MIRSISNEIFVASAVYKLWFFFAVGISFHLHDIDDTTKAFTSQLENSHAKIDINEKMRKRHE